VQNVGSGKGLVNYKGKAVPLQAWTSPEGSRKLKFLDFVTTAQDGGKVVSLTHRPLVNKGYNKTEVLYLVHSARHCILWVNRRYSDFVVSKAAALLQYAVF